MFAAAVQLPCAYGLVKAHQPWLDAHGLGFLRVLTFPTFQTTLAVVLSFAAVLALGGPTIRRLQRMKVGDRPDFDEAQMNALMAGKAGTPTMGGVLIVAAIAASVALLGDLNNFYVLMALVCLLWLAALGMADDLLKLRNARLRSEGKTVTGRQGLSSLEKLLFQIGLAVVLCVFTWHYGREHDVTTRLFVPFLKGVSPELNAVAFTLLGSVVIVGSSNAVNLTDGLDGLAAGCMALVAFAFVVLALIVGDAEAAKFLLYPSFAPAAQMAPVAGAVGGACLGFLWFNCHPARVFMGDTGSLALGGLIGYVALVCRQELLLPIAGGVFVAEALSVMVQVGWFKWTRRRTGTGRRVFLMSPLHHHFQKKGWAETQVTVRFWLVTAMLCALTLATVKLR